MQSNQFESSGVNITAGKDRESKNTEDLVHEIEGELTDN